MALSDGRWPKPNVAEIRRRMDCQGGPIPSDRPVIEGLNHKGG